ncbi:putative allantoate permease [Microdochium trichocladiopsis]|uniref:Allantoate permease n=1 Tax=Microdochium trichocladiopsis TaxID=1682393 RepID=A0A9P8YHY5_9PEZI|nr:putative allantoate permease [Microdochium trichocladiopsis]KAH7039556.1 putative allantoate permease [Microdochium trichocladiopsis]
MPISASDGDHLRARKGANVGGGADIAAALADQFSNEPDYDREEEVKLRWKLDLRLIPILWLNIVLPAMDKITPSTAALYGFREDLDLKGEEYAWVGSAFYFGYLLWCFPSAQILQRLPIAKSMCAVMTIWGFVLIGAGFAHSFIPMIITRVLLGALEAPVAPGNFIIMTMWYTREEQPIRAGLFYTGLATLITGTCGWAVGFLPREYGWRSFFWITGGVSILYGVVVGIFLPDNPVKAKFITERERFVAIERMRADQTGIENKTFSRTQLWEVFKDPKTWLMFFFNIWVSIPNGGLTNFAPLIINGLGFSSQRSTLLMMPTGVIQTLSSYVCNFGVYYCAKRFTNMQLRGAFVIGGLMVGMIATVLLYTLPLDSYTSRLLALYWSYFYLGPYIVALGMNSANTAGHTKKVTLNAVVFGAYCVSNIIGPQFFKSAQAPLYPLGMGAMLVAYALSIVTMMLYMLYCWRENRRRDKVDDTASDQRVHADTDFQDLTDFENIHFRYVW